MILALSLAISTALACDGDKETTATATATPVAKTEKAHCNMPAATTVATLPADGTHATLAVNGMHCGNCADKVHAALIGVEGVKGARVDLATNKVEVAYDAKKTNLEKLVAAVATTGAFTATVATN